MSSVSTDLAPLIERAFTLDVVEHAERRLRLTADRASTEPRISTARAERGGLSAYWLDGDGMACALTRSDRRA
jgi:hypothetical protein